MESDVAANLGLQDLFASTGVSAEQVFKYESDKAVQLVEVAAAKAPEITFLKGGINPKTGKRVGTGYRAEATIELKTWLGSEEIVAITPRCNSKTEAENQVAFALRTQLLADFGSQLGPLREIIEDAAAAGRRVLPARIPGLRRGLVQRMDEEAAPGSLEAREALQLKLRRGAITTPLSTHSRSDDRRRFTPPQWADQRLQEELMTRAERMPEMHALRSKLPITALKEELLESLNTNQIIVVSGGTGTGKSTQIPQYILDDAISKGKGSDCRVLVTQPRRIAATSVAQRVAVERGEKIGRTKECSVGYKIRLASKPARRYGSIEFVTTGVALRNIQTDPMLRQVSHVIIDEVHERDISTDFLLLLMKDVLKNRRDDFRLILMSATLDAQAFADYFGSAPLVEVPSMTRFPIEEFYLDDLYASDWGNQHQRNTINKLVRAEHYSLDQELTQEHHRQQADVESRSPRLDQLVEAKQAHAGLLGDVFGIDSTNLGKDAGRSADEALADAIQSIVTNFVRDHYAGSRWGHSVSRQRVVPAFLDQPTDELADGADDNDTDEIASEAGAEDWEALQDAAAILEQQTADDPLPGSLLVFLPGWQEIKQCMTALERSPLKDRMLIVPLHSSLTFEQQQLAFEPPPNGKLKIILSTNIAESSVTIDDVLAVIDSGKVREMKYDTQKRMSVMSTNDTSQASATQRRGRAGRVAPGKYYRLYTRPLEAARSAKATPEIQRMELQQTCLQTKSLMPRRTVHERAQQTRRVDCLYRNVRFYFIATFSPRRMSRHLFAKPGARWSGGRGPSSRSCTCRP